MSSCPRRAWPTRFNPGYCDLPPDSGWRAIGYRLQGAESPLPLRPTFPLYGLDATFIGDRILGAWQPSPDKALDDPECQMDFVGLLHLGHRGAFVEVRSVRHRGGTPRLPGVRRIGVGPVTAEETADDVSFRLASLNHDDSADRNPDALKAWVGRVEGTPWQEALVAIDGTGWSVRSRSVGGYWCAVADLGEGSIAMIGSGPGPYRLALVRVDMVPS